MNSLIPFLCAITNFLPVSWCFYWQIFRPTDGNSRLPKVQKVDTQIALTLADDGWLWCDFLFCWYVVFVAKTNSHAREGVRSFKWLLSWIVKYSIIFSEKKENRHQKMNHHTHPYTAHLCKTLFSPVYSSSENMHYPVLARIQLIPRYYQDVMTSVWVQWQDVVYGY